MVGMLPTPHTDPTKHREFGRRFCRASFDGVGGGVGGCRRCGRGSGRGSDSRDCGEVEVAMSVAMSAAVSVAMLVMTATLGNGIGGGDGWACPLYGGSGHDGADSDVSSRFRCLVRGGVGWGTCCLTCMHFVYHPQYHRPSVTGHRIPPTSQQPTDHNQPTATQELLNS